MQKEFSIVRQALEEHLSAINENTSEIQALFDYMQEMDKKIEHLSQRLDNINMQKENVRPQVKPLNETEKKIFLVLYTEQDSLGYTEISQRAKIPISIIPDAISSLHSKGIPFIRSFCNNRVQLKVADNFKEIQAKENIINLSLSSFM